MNLRRPLIALVLLSSSAGSASAQTAMPEFTGEAVYALGTDDIYASVRKAIESIQETSPRRYYVVVLGTTGAWEAEPIQLIEGMWTRWVDEARRKKLHFPVEQSMVIMLALQERAIATKPGRVLHEQYGLDQNVFDRELVQRYFIPRARDGDYAGGLVELVNQSERWISGKVEAERVAAEKAHHFRTRTLPIGLAGGAAALVAAVFGMQLWRRGRLKNRTSAAFTEFNGRLVKLMEEFDALKQQHQLLPFSDKDFTEPMTGATLALYDGVEQKLAGLRATWLALMDARDQVEKLLATAGPLELTRLREAKGLLDAKGSLPDVDALYKQCRQDLEALGQAHESATAALESVRKTGEEFPARLEAVRGADLPTRRYEEALASLGGQLEQCERQLTTDPIGTRTVLESIHKSQQELLAFIAKVLELDAAWRATGTRRQTLVDEVAQERAGGLKLDEPHANPDEPLSVAAEELTSAREALVAEKTVAAASALSNAGQSLDAAAALIKQVRDARKRCAAETQEAEAFIRRVEKLQHNASGQLRALERDFAAESWQSVAHNSPQAAEALRSAVEHLEQSRTLALPATQHFVAAARHLDQAKEAWQEAQRLLEAIGGQLDALNKLREDCASQRATLLDSQRQMQSLLSEHDSTIGDTARGQLAEARQFEDRVVDNLNSPRPNWPAVKQWLDRAQQLTRQARESAEGDIRDRRSFEATLRESEQLAARIGDVLHRNTADRPRANQAYRAAAAAVDRLRNSVRVSRADWKQLVAQAVEARQDLQKAEQWATEDLQLAAQAAQAVSAAERAVGLARSYVAHGTSADVGQARGELARAAQLLASQQYEQAITEAGQAERSAREAQQRAEQAAMARQMQLEAARRQREAERASVGPVVIPGFPTFASGPSIPSAAPAPSAPSPPPAAAQSTWSGSAAQSKW